MSKLKIFLNENGSLCSESSGDFIIENNFLMEGVSQGNDDVGGDFKYQLYQGRANFDVNEKPILIIKEQQLASSFSVKLDIPKYIMDLVYNDIKSLPLPNYEIWHSDHNVKDSVHIPDPTGNATTLLNLLKTKVSVVEPPVNHNKVSSKPEDRFGCNHMHIDSFEGMRRNTFGERLAIDRYFFNLSHFSRDILISPLNPEMLSKLIPIDYCPDLLKNLFESASFSIPLLKLTTPPIDLENGIVSVIKLQATHILHGEYGPQGDLLAIVNTLPLKKYSNKIGV